MYGDAKLEDRFYAESKPTRHLGTALPIEWREGPPVIGAVIGTLFGGYWTGFTLFAWRAWATGDEVSMSSTAFAILLTVFLAIGLVILVVSVNGFFGRTSIRIDRSAVRFRRTAPIGAADWTEPLSAFEGVLPTYRRRRKGRPRITYKIHLKHGRDRSRDILLYQSAGGIGHRREAEAFARMLGVPMLTEQEDGTLAARDVADLDRTVRERAEQGTVEKRGFDATAVRGMSRVEVTTMPQGYVFDASRRRGLPASALVCAVGLGLLYLHFGTSFRQDGGQTVVVAFMGGIFALAGILAVRSSLFWVDRLEVSPHGVRIGTVRRGAPLEEGADGRFMRAEDIEEVKIQKDGYGRFRLALSGDSGTLLWGQHISASERALVRDMVVETLAR